MYTVTRRRNSLCNVARHREQFHYRMSCDLLVANERLKDYDVLYILQDDGGWTPIMWAAEDKQYEATQLLMECGANVHSRDLVLLHCSLTTSPQLSKGNLTNPKYNYVCLVWRVLGKKKEREKIGGMVNAMQGRGMVHWDVPHRFNCFVCLFIIVRS